MSYKVKLFSLKGILLFALCVSFLLLGTLFFLEFGRYLGTMIRYMMLGNIQFF